MQYDILLNGRKIGRDNIFEIGPEKIKSTLIKI